MFGEQHDDGDMWDAADARPTYNLRDGFKALATLGVSLALGRAAAATTFWALRMSHDHRGFAGQFREEIEHANRWLTMKSHTWRLRVEGKRAAWHTHGCLTCGSGTSCFEDCEPGDTEAQLVGRLYEPRTCKTCAEIAATL